MWELDCEESWALKNWCFWTVVLEKTLESSLDCKEIQPVHSKGDQFWVFFGRNDAEAETPILWPQDAKSWLIGKDPDAGKDWGQEEKGMTEDEMAGWHDWLDGHEFEWTHGVGNGQGGLACCDSWGRKKSDKTEQLNWTELNWNQWWEGNGNPLQYRCLENSLERGAWWAAIHGVAQNRTWLKWLSSSSKPMIMWTRVAEVKNHSKKHAVGSHFLLQKIFLTNPGLLNCRQVPYQLSHHWCPVFTAALKLSQDMEAS